MSGTFPSTISPISIDIESVQPTLVSTSDSGKRQARYAGGHLWSIALNFPLMRRFEFEPINAFIMSQQGSFESFQYVPPNKAAPLGEWGSAVSVVGAHSAGDSAITMDGFNPNSAAVVKAGDIFKFASHSKVYLVAEDENSIGNVATLNTVPPIIQNILDNDSVTFLNVPFTVYVDDSHSYKTTAPNLSSYKVKLMESL